MVALSSPVAVFPIHDLDTGLTHSVGMENDLSLSCTCHTSSSWCAHRSDLIKDRREVSAMWAHLVKIGEDQESEEVSIYVPLFPSRGVFPKAHLIKEDTKSPYFEVVLIGERGCLETVPALSFLGMLSAGDGLMTLRGMVITWLKGVVNRNQKCNSASHGWEAEQNLKSMPRELKLLNDWTLYHNGWCVFCHSGMNENDDLVPDDSKERSIFHA